MCHLVREIEAGIVEFVKCRVPQGDWDTLTSPASVLYRLDADEDSDRELKDFMWSLLKQELDWSAILEDIERLRANQMPVDESEEEEEDNDEDEDEDA